MAKMNKTEAIEAARGMARRCDAVNAVTLNELSKLDYAQRRAYASMLMNSTAVQRIDTNDRYLPDAMQAFENEALTIWSRKEKELENKRKAWKRATTGLTAEQAKAKIVAFLTSLNIRGARVSEYGDRLEIVRGRCNSTLYFRMDPEDYEGTTNPDDEQQRAGEYAFKVDYSVSGTTYTPAEMAVVTKINQELLDAGNELTMLMSQERVIWTWGIPEVAAEQPVTSVEGTV